MIFKKTNENYIHLTQNYGAKNYLPLPVVLKRGSGVWLWDINGKKYLDLMACYSAQIFGHCYRPLVKTLTKQASQLASPSRAFYTDQLALWCKEIAEFCGMEKVLPMNTGAEAVETAIKIARKWGYLKKRIPNGQAEIIVCEGNFHGRTITIISFSTEKQYSEYFGPHTQGFKIIPYGNTEALKAAINSNTAGFLVEPIQGEAGIRIPPSGFLKKAREICQQNNVLFILDEIQTGFCRTGKTFCFEHENAKPDVLILGKALGGGLLPISAVLSSDKIMEVIKPGDHGSTFGGNPLACAVSRKVLELIRKDENKFNNRVNKMGDYFQDRLKNLFAKNPLIKEIRGKGLFIGIELNPDAGGARKYCEALIKNSVLTKETHENVIRIAPALIITKNEIDFALKAFEKVFKL